MPLFTGIIDGVILPISDSGRLAQGGGDCGSREITLEVDVEGRFFFWWWYTGHGTAIGFDIEYCNFKKNGFL